MCILFVVFQFYLSPKLAGVALCIVPAVLIMSKFYGSFIQKLTTQVQDSLASATQVGTGEDPGFLCWGVHSA